MSARKPNAAVDPVASRRSVIGGVLAAVSLPGSPNRAVADAAVIASR